MLSNTNGKQPSQNVRVSNKMLTCRKDPMFLQTQTVAPDRSVINSLEFPKRYAWPEFSGISREAQIMQPINVMPEVGDHGMRWGIWAMLKRRKQARFWMRGTWIGMFCHLKQHVTPSELTMIVNLGHCVPGLVVQIKMRKKYIGLDLNPQLLICRNGFCSFHRWG